MATDVGSNVPSQPARALMLDADAPLVLTGPPRAIRGEFQLQNTTPQKLAVRDAVFRSVAPSADASASAAKAAAKKRTTKAATAVSTLLPGAGLAMRRIVVRPGQSRPVPVALALDPRTPPGTYRAELTVNEQKRDVVMYVTEDVALQIAPSEIVLDNEPGAKITKTVVFSNAGNVPIDIRTIGTVVLDEELVHCRALRGAIADVGDTMKTLDDFAAALGKRYKKLYETLVLKVQNDAVTLEPGDTQAIDLTITLPAKLETSSRYTGYAAISTESLTFTIVASD
jgi:hypothetical protein